MLPSLVEGEVCGYFWCLTGFCEEKAVCSSVPAACLSLGAAGVCTVPLCWQSWVPHAGTWTHGQVWGGFVPCPCPFPAPLLLCASLGAHLISSKAVLGKVLA